MEKRTNELWASEWSLVCIFGVLLLHAAFVSWFNNIVPREVYGVCSTFRMQEFYNRLCVRVVTFPDMHVFWCLLRFMYG